MVASSWRRRSSQARSNPFDTRSPLAPLRTENLFGGRDMGGGLGSAAHAEEQLRVVELDHAGPVHLAEARRRECVFGLSVERLRLVQPSTELAHSSAAVGRVHRRENVTASFLRICQQVLGRSEIAASRARHRERRLQLDTIPPFVKANAERNAALREVVSLVVSPPLHRPNLAVVSVERQQTQRVLFDASELFELRVTPERRLEIAT